MIMLLKNFSQNDEQKRLSNLQQKTHKMNQMSLSRNSDSTLTRALKIQEITLKQMETMTQKLTKSIKFQLEYYYISILLIAFTAVLYILAV